jgi:DNA-binding transcriptional MerR regulator
MSEYKGLREVAKLAGITMSGLLYHEDAGRIAPAERVGNQRVYSPEATRAIIVYFANRKKFSPLEKGESK